MNAVPNMPLPVDTPPAATNSGTSRESAIVSREGSMVPVTEQVIADFKTTLQEVNAQGLIEQDVDASLTGKKEIPEGNDSWDVLTDATPSPESLEAAVGPVVAPIDPPRQSQTIGLVGSPALPADDSTLMPPGEDGRVATHLYPNGRPGENQEQTRSTSDAKPTPPVAASLPAAPAADDESAGTTAGQGQLPRATVKANLRPSATEPQTDAAPGRLSSTEMIKSMEDSPAAPPASRDNARALNNSHPINTVADNVREAPTTPSAASVKPPGSDRRPTDAFEGRLQSDGPTEGEEGIEVRAVRPLPKDTPAPVHRLVQNSQPDVEPRPEGVGGFERGAGTPLQKTAQTPYADKPLPPTPDGFRDNNIASIVERVAVSVRGRQSEARIALKPEHLGSLRVQISTENNMVSIKIMTEFPMARDLLESSLPQLKAELQQQGLEVEEFEVRFEDEKQQFRREERRARGGRQNNRIPGHVAEEEVHASEEKMQGIRRGAGERSSGIDYFA